MLYLLKIEVDKSVCNVLYTFVHEKYGYFYCNILNLTLFMSKLDVMFTCMVMVEKLWLY